MSTRQSLELEFTPPNGRCVICGDEHWRAAWFGHTELLLCSTCSLDVLPKLLADAVFRSNLTVIDADAILERVKAAFWRSTAINLMHERTTAVRGQADITRPVR